MLFSTRLAKIIFIVTALILLVLSTILYIQLNDLQEANDAINHTNEIKLRLEQTISFTKDAETAQRGFLITGDSLFLQPYWGAFEKTNLSLSRLKDLVADNPIQNSNFGKLDSLVKVRFALIDHATREFDMQKTTRDRRLMLLRDKSLMDSIRKQTNKMEGIEIRMTGERELAKNQHAFMAPLIGFLLIFLSLATLIASYYRVTLDLKRSKDFLEQTNRLNAELVAKNRQLRISNEELDSFNYISSHDLQEPVRKIRTFISMIEATDYEKLSEKNKYNFQRVQLAAIRIQDLLHDLLAYSQIGKGEQHFEAVDLNQVLEETKSNFENEIENAKVSVTSENLPTIKAIPFQMQQLFDNLLSNALKYRLPDRPLELHIASSLINSNDVDIKGLAPNTLYHTISFRDNGLGFDQEFSEKIFEPFSRLHTQEQYSGTGIGLTICKKIANNHKGIITANSVIKQGSRFDVYLPVLDESSHL